MADIFVDLNGSAGAGTSPLNTRNTVPNGSPGDFIYFPGGSLQAFSAQAAIAVANITWGSYETPAGGKARLTSTAANFGTFNIDNAGLTTFQDLEFVNILGGSTNGAVINCSINATSTRASNLRVLRCAFRGTRWNALRINGTNTANAASTFECSDTIFDDIGEDCVFGGALDFTFDRNTCTRLSSRTVTGDGVGFINADPVTVRVRGNHIDHSNVDSKQCVIVDTLTGGGHIIIQDNTLIGFGSETVSPTEHSVIIVTNGARATIERNTVYAAGIAFGLSNTQSIARNNVVFVRNTGVLGSTLPITANNCDFSNNTVIATRALAADTPALTMGVGGGAGVTVRNNAFVNFPRGIQSNIASNPITSNNAYENVPVPRQGQGGPFSESGAIEAASIGISSAGIPRGGSLLLTGGADLGYRRDIAGKQARRYIGAYGAASFRRIA